MLVEQNETKILLPALHRGKERRCSRRLLRKSKLQHLRVARVRAGFFDFLDDLGPGWDAGGDALLREARPPAKLSIQPGAEQLWRTQEGAHGDERTEAWPRG